MLFCKLTRSSRKKYRNNQINKMKLKLNIAIPRSPYLNCFRPKKKKNVAKLKVCIQRARLSHLWIESQTIIQDLLIV